MRLRAPAPESDEIERLRAIVETLPGMVWTALPDGRIDWLGEHWYGYTGMARLRRPDAHAWLDRLHPDDAARARAAWQRAMATGQAYAAEYRLRAQDGSHRWFLARAQPQRASDGRILRWCGSCTDIDALKRTQRLTDGFVALVSHALRTPLNAILGWTQVLQKRPEDLDTVRQVADVVERNARAQVRMVDDLLDASRLAAGSLALSREPVELRALVQAAVDEIGPLAQARHIEIDERAGAAPVPVEADAARLRQVLSILLSNALQATREDGRITVRVGIDAGRASVEVADDGCGIAPDELAAVFDRFRSAGAELSRRPSGLGLGLSIARGLVELHGGSIEAASSGPGRGAAFTVRLPLAQAEAAGVPRAPSPGLDNPAQPVERALRPNVLAGLRVLVVDDEADSRALAARVLRDAGARVVQADGADEVSLVLGGGLRPDLVVSDLGMPRVDGYSLVRMLRHLPGAMADVPTIALSGLNLPQDRARAAQAGFGAFLSKPFSPSELVAVAARLTGRHP